MISIHALLAESDRAGCGHVAGGHHFYPRSPCGERLKADAYEFILENFYPRSPCGERLFCSGAKADSVTFLSTLSLRRATYVSYNQYNNTNHFYPRSPCGERPGRITSKGTKKFNFYPRSPCGERPWQRGSRITYVEISIHALLAESDIAGSMLNA